MLRSVDSMLGASVIANDGEIGRAYNVFFDDRSWAVRYLVVETGSWLRHRKVLISPEVLGRPHPAERTIPVVLTRKQVRDRPDVDADRPVSRQQELAMISHYSRADYLSLEPAPRSDSIDVAVTLSGAPTEKAEDRHLRSAKEVSGYHADASDGPLGTIIDFIIDDERWGILDLVVTADNHKILIPTKWVSGVSWADRYVQLSQPLARAKSVTADVLSEF